MSDTSPSASRATAPAARNARRDLIHRLRSRVAVLAVAIFVAASAGLFVQLASGHDPGLNDASVPAVTQTLDPDAASDDDATFAEEDAWADSSTTQSGAGGSSSGSDAGAVTTRQS